MQSLHGLWLEYHVSRAEVVTAAGIAAVLLVVQVLGSYATTVAHEGGHALLGLIFGVPVTGIRIFSIGSAATRFGGESRLADVPITLAGHLGPSGFGLLAAYLIERGHPDGALWSSLPLLGAFALMSRSWRALASVLLIGAAAVLVLGNDDPAVRGVAVTAWTWLLLAGGVRDVRGLQRYRSGKRRRGEPDRSSDVYWLRRATLLPASVWVFLLYAGTAAALVYGGSMLLGNPIDLGPVASRL
jgi:Peptidase M50B-like